jgi:hypothetical protein
MEIRNLSVFDATLWIGGLGPSEAKTPERTGSEQGGAKLCSTSLQRNRVTQQSNVTRALVMIAKVRWKDG